MAADVENLTKDLASHFGETPARFKLGELFSLLSDVIDKTESARRENEQRKKQEERAAALEAEKMQRANNNDQPANTDTIKKNVNKKRAIPEPKEESCLVDRLLGEIKKGEFKLRTTTKASEEQENLGGAPSLLPQSSVLE